MFVLEKLRHIFSFHAPPDDLTKERHATIRRAAETMAALVVVNTPISEEQEKAVEHIRLAMFWANAAIACYPGGTFGPPPEMPFTDKAFVDAADTIEQALVTKS